MDKNYFRKLLKLNRLPKYEDLNDSYKVLIGDNIDDYKNSIIPKKWVVRQNYSQFICNWYNKNINNIHPHIYGSFKYIRSDGAFSDHIPDGYEEIPGEVMENYIKKGLI